MEKRNIIKEEFISMVSEICKIDKNELYKNIEKEIFVDSRIRAGEIVLIIKALMDKYHITKLDDLEPPKIYTFNAIIDFIYKSSS